MTTERTAVAEQVFAGLIEGRVMPFAELGSFSLRVYEAYEGRNPRTGEAFNVPKKRLVTFIVATALREYLNGRGGELATSWVAAVAEPLRAGRPVVFGRLGTFVAQAKPADGDAPARTVLRFVPSLQLKRRLAGAGDTDVRVVDGEVVDAMLARLPAKGPKNLADLDALLGTLGVDYSRAGLLAPDKRHPESPDDTVLIVDDERGADWRLEGRKVVRWDGDSDIKVPIARWVAAMLVVAAVRHATEGAYLDPATAERVLDRLGAESPFGAADLPF